MTGSSYSFTATDSYTKAYICKIDDGFEKAEYDFYLDYKKLPKVKAASYKQYRNMGDNFTLKLLYTGTEGSGSLDDYSYKWYKAYADISGVYYREAELLEGETGPVLKGKWKKNPYADGYYVYRMKGSGDYKKVATMTKNTTVSFKDEDAVSNGSSYRYQNYAYSKNYENVKTCKSVASASVRTYRLSTPSITSLYSSGSGKLKVTYKKNSRADGYEIRYSTKSDLSSYSTTTVSSPDTVTNTISSLKKGKKYYVKVRSFKKDSDGKKYYSHFSTVKSVTVK